jgi:hypothetical protein
MVGIHPQPRKRKPVTTTSTIRCPAALATVALLAVFGNSGRWAQSHDLIHEPYQLDTGLVSRSISFENPTGAPGEGGKAASRLGPGRKGTPSRLIKPGETVALCDIEGSGTIRHIWLTTARDPSAPPISGRIDRAFGDTTELTARTTGTRQ